jgi:hypothetical protein
MKQETGITFGKREDIICPQTNSQVGGREVSSQDFQLGCGEWVTGYCGGVSPLRYGRSARDVGALTTLKTFAHTDWRKMEINFNQLVPYVGATRVEQP